MQKHGEHCWYSSVLCPPQASVTGAVLFFHCYAGPHFSAAHPSWLREARHWKVGGYNANWGTGEQSMRSPSTFLQENKMCSSMMKLELNWSDREKQWAGVNVWYLHLWLNSITCLCGKKTHKHGILRTDERLCHFNSSWWRGNHLLMPKCSIALCSELNTGTMKLRGERQKRAEFLLLFSSFSGSGALHHTNTRGTSS